MLRLLSLSFFSSCPLRFVGAAASLLLCAFLFCFASSARGQDTGGAVTPSVTSATGEGRDSAPSALLSGDIPIPSIPEGPWERRKIAVGVTQGGPKIDGVLDDECWRKATYAKGFYRFGSNALVTEQTEAWICADGANLYVAFHCLDREPQRIRTSETQRGGAVFDDDHVAINIDSQNSRRNSSFFSVSANGTQDEELEGGTADNITWAGDWRAAAKRVEDGWVAEIAIPFALLRYPRGASAFGLQLFRKLARETNPTTWPYLPPEGQQWGTMPQFFHEFTGVTLPHYAPRPIFLPYILASGGEGTAMRQGMDIKYPLSTTITGLATLYPDFRTIEQDVASINFSYNEQFIEDRRPFFAEGQWYLPSSDLYYSRRIEDVDQGIKVVGKSGMTTVGIVGTTERGARETGRSSLAANIAQDIGLFHRIGLNLVADNRNGQPSNRVGRIYGNYGGLIRGGMYRWNVNGHHTDSFVDGTRRGGMDSLNFNLNGARPGMLRFNFSMSDVGPNFTSDLGFLPELNRRGWSASTGVFNRFDKGKIEFYDWDFDYDSYFRHDGTGFFRNEVELEGYAQTWSGFGFGLGHTRSSRRNTPSEGTFHDRRTNAGLSWNQRTLFQGGGIGYNWGRQAGKPWHFFSVRQGFLISRAFSLSVNRGQQKHGSDETSQTILTGTYRLNGTQTISGRLVNQDGSSGNPEQDIGVVRGTNLYFAFAQRVRRGADLFLLIGDPNSPRTRGQVTLKMLRPF